MKKSPKYLSLIAFAMLILGTFSVPKAFAQTIPGSFVFAQQSQIGATSTFHTPTGNLQAIYTVNLGLGYVGTSTEAFVTDEYNTGGTDQQNRAVVVSVLSYSDSAYSSLVSTCNFFTLAQDHSWANTGYHQINPQSGPCVLTPTLYTQIVLTFDSTLAAGGGPYTHTVYGSDSPILPASATYTSNNTDDSLFFPQFALTGNGFQIVPTASSTGLLLSGAKEFCNSQFGTSTGGIFGIGTDLANGLCQVAGYMFVPTQDSLQQFAGLPAILGTRAPFSYMYAVVSSFDGLTASTTENMESFSITGLGGFASSSAFASVVPSTIDILSTSTISKYYPDPIRHTMLFLASAAIWFTLILSIYHRIVPHKLNV